MNWRGRYAQLGIKGLNGRAAVRAPADARPGEAGVVDRQGVHPSAADPNHASVHG
ncbi:MAG: hypothetical protein ACLP50_16785 [Solirubrobacteraceae bacterium]